MQHASDKSVCQMREHKSNKIKDIFLVEHLLFKGTISGVARASAAVESA